MDARRVVEIAQAESEAARGGTLPEAAPGKAGKVGAVGPVAGRGVR
jgi:hypothetical protein